MPQKHRDNFDSKTIQKLAERAGYICSNPLCNSITVGPSDTSTRLSTKIGKASHICAAAEGGPRYDENQTSKERSDIENGIWLCSNCADLIDKNNGRDYREDKLKNWKLEHEKLIAQLIKSGSSPLAFTRKNTAEGAIAQKIIEYLDGKGALFIDPIYERNDYVVTSLENIRKHLTTQLGEIDIETPLYSKVKSIIEYCRRYMNEMSNQNDFELMVLHLNVMRKGIGFILKSICDQYGIKPTANLIIIMPI